MEYVERVAAKARAREEEIERKKAIEANLWREREAAAKREEKKEPWKPCEYFKRSPIDRFFMPTWVT